MPITTTYPGIYIEELPSNSHPITAAPTSVTVFVGYTHPFKTDPANWNSIANLQPLNESLNRSKQDQSLADWVVEKKIDRAAYLLPPDVDLEIGSFRAFIEARRTLLAKRLREVVGTGSTPGSASA